MLNRILRLLAAGLNAYSFYSNPVRFIISILCVVLIPYLAYIFWGTIILVALIVLGIFITYKAIQAGRNNNRSYS